jgi:hypothetical protein
MDHHVEFCQWFLQNYNLIHGILFSDEVIFYLSSNVNGHNSCCWASENRQWMDASHVKNVQVSVSVELWRDQLISVYFFDSSVAGEIYLQILQTFLIPILDDILLAQLFNMWYQQGSAPPHLAVIIQGCLNKMFPDKWIG